MNAPRVPPRFVPTLTTVLEPSAGRLIEPAQVDPIAESFRPVDRMDPVAALPTAEADHAFDAPAEAPLLEPVPEPLLDPRHAIALDPATRFGEMESFALEEHLMHRVMQRVDLSLEERLSDVVAAAVQAQLDAMVPRLRDEIEGVLRTLVTEALAQELQEKPGSNPPGAGPSFG
jgi:hypothetical protein